MSKVIKGGNLVLPAPHLNRPHRPGHGHHDSKTSVKSAAAALEEAEKNLVAARVRAERILDDSQTKADSIIEEALQGTEKLVGEAKNEGRRLGWEEGMARAREEADVILAEAEAVRERARAEAQQLHVQSQKDIVKLAVVIAEKILRRQIELDPASVAPMIAGALRRVRGADRAVVRVAPEMVEAVQGSREQIPTSDLGIGDLKVREDPALEPGDVLIQTELGSVDARLDRQVRRVTESLKLVTGDE